MKICAVQFMLLLSVLNGVGVSFASHMCEEVKSSDLSCSVMLRTSAAPLADSTGNMMIASFGTIAADEKMRQTKEPEILSALMNLIESMLAFGVDANNIYAKLATSFAHNKIPADVARRLLGKTAELAKRQVNPDVYKILINKVNGLKHENFQANAGLEEAIEKMDEQKFGRILKAAGYSDAEIKKAIASLKTGCHEFAGYFDYDEKGNVI